MYRLFSKNILIIYILALAPDLCLGTSLMGKDNSFNVSVEYYETGADHFKDSQYLKMVFTVSVTKGEQSLKQF